MFLQSTSEISYYIGKRIKMILNKNVFINNLSIYSKIIGNTVSEYYKIKIEIEFIYSKHIYDFINQYKINSPITKNGIDIIFINHTIDTIINDFESMFKLK